MPRLSLLRTSRDGKEYVQRRCCSKMTDAIAIRWYDSTHSNCASNWHNNCKSSRVFATNVDVNLPGAQNVENVPSSYDVDMLVKWHAYRCRMYIFYCKFFALWHAYSRRRHWYVFYDGILRVKQATEVILCFKQNALGGLLTQRCPGLLSTKCDLLPWWPCDGIPGFDVNAYDILHLDSDVFASIVTENHEHWEQWWWWWPPPCRR